MGSINAGGEKDGIFIEGKESNPHTHNDGTKGTDVEAFRNTYVNGELVSSTKQDGWGKIHNNSDKKGK